MNSYWNSNRDGLRGWSGNGKLILKDETKKVWHAWLNETKTERGYDFSFIFPSVLGKGSKGIREGEELFKLRDIVRTSRNECKLALDKFALEDRAFKAVIIPRIQVVWRGQEILKRESYQQNWYGTVALNSRRLHMVTQIVCANPVPIFLPD